MTGKTESADVEPKSAATTQKIVVFSTSKRSLKTRFESPRVRFWIIFLLVAATVAPFLGTLGCSGGRRRLFHRRAEETLDSPVLSLSEAETILTVEGRVERLQIASNSRHILVERRDFTAPTANERSILYNAGGSDAQTLNPTKFPDYSDKTVFDLWNVDYVDAQTEPFGNVDGADDGLAAATLESTTFNEKGTRVFWTARELDEQFCDRSQTILATRALDSAFAFAETNADQPLRLKTAPEMKNAESVWLSPNAHWLVCRGEIEKSPPKEKEETATSEPSTATNAVLKTDVDADKEIACFLVSRADRRRVVRFPDVVKMTFDSSTSDETIEGRVVETLAVSNAGDLVATLVEENSPKSKFEPNPTSSKLESRSTTDLLANVPANAANNAEDSPKTPFLPTLSPPQFVSRGFSPRYKVVIWDLSVAEKVDWEKARKPLQALEVAQISLLAPISRHFCKFSPNGRIFAARLEPHYISLWQAANGRFLTELGEHKNDVDDFAFSPTGMKIAVGCGGKNARVVLWDVRKSAAIRMLDDSSDGVTAIDAVAYSPDGNNLYFANNFGEIKRWEIRLINQTAAP